MLPHVRLTRLRRAFFWSATALYAVALPVILGFAFGLRVEPTRAPAVIATSTLEVSTIPEGASVILGDAPPRPSPLVLDGLEAGEYTLLIAAPGALSWTASLRAEPGLAYAVVGLRLPSSDPVRQIAVFTADGEPALIRQGRSVAYVPAGAAEIAIAGFSGGKMVVERMALFPPVGSEVPRLSYLEMPDQLLVSWPEGLRRGWGVDLGGLGAVAHPSPRAIDLEPAASEPIARIALGLGEGTQEVVVPEGIMRRAEDGSEHAILRLGGPLVAAGYVRGAWYLLDADGELYEYRRLLPPLRLGRVELTGCEACRSGEPRRILSASDAVVVCLDLSARELLILRQDSPAVAYPDIEGGSAGEEPGEAWVWREEELLVSRAGAPPREVARMPGRVRGIREEFAPRFVAVETDRGVCLIPAIGLAGEGIDFDPLPLVEGPPGCTFLACREGILLRRETGRAETQVYRVAWYPE